MESKGLGDTIEKITTFTGIKTIVDAITEDCGCEQRKEWLNAKIPYTINNYKNILNFFKK